MRQMQTSVECSPLIYMKLPDGSADVFINRLVEKNEDGYIYDCNEFHTNFLTENEIRSNLDDYLNYSESEEQIDKNESVIAELKQQNEMLAECLFDLAEIVYA